MIVGTLNSVYAVEGLGGVRLPSFTSAWQALKAEIDGDLLIRARSVPQVLE